MTWNKVEINRRVQEYNKKVDEIRTRKEFNEYLRHQINKFDSYDLNYYGFLYCFLHHKGRLTKQEKEQIKYTVESLERFEKLGLLFRKAERTLEQTLNPYMGSVIIDFIGGCLLDKGDGKPFQSDCFYGTIAQFKRTEMYKVYKNYLIFDIEVDTESAEIIIWM